MSKTVTYERALECAQRLRPAGCVEVRRFFGGHGLYCEGVQFGMVMKGSLYLRVDDDSRSDYERYGAQPFGYSTRTKAVTVTGYCTVPDEIFEYDERLGLWAARALHAAHNKSKSKSRTRRSRGATDA